MDRPENPNGGGLVFICTNCEVEKSAEAYRIHKKGYRVGKCRLCENAYQREWSLQNRDICLKRKRESMARHRAANPQAARDYRNAYHAANRAVQTAKMRAYYGRRFFWGRAMKLRGDRRATAKDLARLWWQQRGRCALTGRRLDRTAQIDHIVPKARGGTDAVHNLRWTCEAVNIAKRHMTDAEFVALCSDVMAWIERGVQVAEAV
jgi:5-methylcytosine-specific restriction endonuclease McrA